MRIQAVTNKKSLEEATAEAESLSRHTHTLTYIHIMMPLLFVYYI